jgi:hypothetical protein
MPQGPGPRRIVKKGGEFKTEEVFSPDFFGSSKKSISDFAPLFRNLAQSSHYEVTFGGFTLDLKSYLQLKNINNNFIDDFGLLCNSANLPASNFTTFNSRGNLTGMLETYAHTRDFGGQISMDFYVDKNYKSLLLIENWMEYISSGSHKNSVSKQNDLNYHIRLRYPDSYKSNSTRIYKFDRDYNRVISYTFIGLFPSALNPISVNYGNSEILKMSAIFSYDRYIPGQSSSLSEYIGTSNNRN